MEGWEGGRSDRGGGFVAGNEDEVQGVTRGVSRGEKVEVKRAHEEEGRFNEWATNLQIKVSRKNEGVSDWKD